MFTKRHYIAFAKTLQQSRENALDAREDYIAKGGTMSTPEIHFRPLFDAILLEANYTHLWMDKFRYSEAQESKTLRVAHVHRLTSQGAREELTDRTRYDA